MAKDFNILQETEELYALQKSRVMMDAQWEKKMQKTFPSLNQDIRLLKEMLDTLEKRSEEKTDTEVIPNVI